MRTNPDYADHLRTTIFPWDLGQGTTDRLIDYAQHRGRTIGFQMHDDRPFATVDIDGEAIGFADPDTVSFIRWPSITRFVPPIDLIDYCHQQATASNTIAQCYFIGGDEGLIKIGFSVDPGARLKALQSGSPVELHILALATGGGPRESAYHMQFAEYRVRGEWFERSPPILAEIERINAEVRS